MLFLATISCHNLAYSVVSKFITNRLNPILSDIILEDKFGFPFKCQINDVLVVSQVMHSIKILKIPFVLLKLNLCKDYGKVSWNFLRLVLIKMGLIYQLDNGLLPTCQFSCSNKLVCI